MPITILQRFFMLIAVVFLLSGCGPLISKFDPKAYEKATSLKAQALYVMKKADQPYDKNEPLVDDLMIKMHQAHEYVKGIPNNELSAKQWEILKDPEGKLLGKFVKRWKQKGKMSPTFIKLFSKQVAKGFDEIICLESHKKAAANCGKQTILSRVTKVATNVASARMESAANSLTGSSDSGSGAASLLGGLLGGGSSQPAAAAAPTPAPVATAPAKPTDKSSMANDLVKAFISSSKTSSGASTATATAMNKPAVPEGQATTTAIPQAEKDSLAADLMKVLQEAKTKTAQAKKEQAAKAATNTVAKTEANKETLATRSLPAAQTAETKKTETASETSPKSNSLLGDLLDLANSMKIEKK